MHPRHPATLARGTAIATQVAGRGGVGSGKQKGGKKNAPPPQKKNKRGRDGNAAGGGRAAPGFYELNDEEDAATAAFGLGSTRDKQAQAQRRRYVCKRVGLLTDGFRRMLLSRNIFIKCEEAGGGWGAVEPPTTTVGGGEGGCVVATVHVFCSVLEGFACPRTVKTALGRQRW